MPPRVVMKNTGSIAQKKTAARVPSKFSKTPVNSVSSTLPKAELEAVAKAQSKTSPIAETLKVREKAIEPSKDLNEPIVETQTEKENPVVDANEEYKESPKDADDEPSEKGSAEGGQRIGLEKKEIDTVMQEAHDNEGEDTEHHDELAVNNVVVGEQSHGNEEGVEGDGADDEHEVEMPAMVKERIKQREFEVFVRGIHKDADEEDLKKVFSEIGEVVEIRLPKNSRTRKNKSFAFVRFASVEQAKKAVAELKNPQVRGKQCVVSRNQDNETLHVRNICKLWTKEALQQKLTEYEIYNVEEITLEEDPEQGGRNRGFAFLEFPTHLEATNALIRLQKPDVFFGTDVCAKVAFAKSTIEPDEGVMAQVKSILVDGLPPSWDEERVVEKFKIYGEIEEVQLARNMPAAKRKDFGFISFRTREAALACIEGVNKNEGNEEDKKVTLKATLRKPQQKGRSVRGRVRAGYGRARFEVFRGRPFLDERRQHFGRAYDRRPSGPAYIRSDRTNYREQDAYLDRRTLPSGRRDETASRRSSYQGDYRYDRIRYCERTPPRRPPYPEDSYNYGMNGMADYHDYAGGGVCGSKRPYSVVSNDLPSPARHSRSRLDYELGAPDSRCERVSRIGQDSRLGYGADNRSAAIYSNSTDYLPRSNDVRGGPYPY